MDKAIARLNIVHFKSLLASSTDAAQRATLLRLLAEEEQKLEALERLERAPESPGRKNI